MKNHGFSYENTEDSPKRGSYLHSRLFTQIGISL